MASPSREERAAALIGSVSNIIRESKPELNERIREERGRLYFGVGTLPILAILVMVFWYYAVNPLTGFGLSPAIVSYVFPLAIIVIALFAFRSARAAFNRYFDITTGLRDKWYNDVIGRIATLSEAISSDVKVDKTEAIIGILKKVNAQQINVRQAAEEITTEILHRELTEEERNELQ